MRTHDEPGAGDHATADLLRTITLAEPPFRRPVEATVTGALARPRRPLAMPVGLALVAATAAVVTFAVADPTAGLRDTAVQLTPADGVPGPVPDAATAPGQTHPPAVGPYADRGQLISLSLSERYVRCTEAHGMAGVHAQVITRWPPGVEPQPGPGAPWWVKTAPEVPASVHRPCFQEIGGVDPQGSSHNHGPDYLRDATPPSP